MQRFRSIFGTKKCQVIGMIHADALPGTPNYKGDFNQIIERAKYEAEIYRQCKIDAVLVENMHDIPYVQSTALGPEITATMTRLCTEIRQILPAQIPCGIQILAAANREAIACAQAARLQFIRAEAYHFAHVADEGIMNAMAGQLLRYRRQIDAADILVFTDLKKKHCSHAITADVSLLETARAAEFFQTDGIILTGTATGDPVKVNDLNEIYGHVTVPIILGSGVTNTNIGDYINMVDAVVIGSHFKKNGSWTDDLCSEKIRQFMNQIYTFRNK